MDKIDGSETDGAIVGTEDGVPEGPVSRGVDPFLWDHQEFGKREIIQFNNWHSSFFYLNLTNSSLYSLYYM